MIPTSRRVELNTGLSYHYLEWGPSDSEHTVVLVHGFLDYAAGWRAAVEQGLHEHFHVVAPDMRGHGDSDRVGAGGYYHFFDYVADLRSFIVAVARDRVSLVGHSMGGSIAGYYAGSFPDSLQAVALMEGLGPPENETPVPERVDLWIRTWNRARSQSPRVYGSVQQAADKLRARDPLLTAEMALDLAAWGTRELEGGRIFKHDPLHLTMGPVPYSVDIAQQFWERITCPVLLVEGRESLMKHSEEERQRRTAGLQSQQTVVIEGAGHMLQRHAPAEVSRLLTDFLGA